jgi:hypothetical protein
LHKSLPILLIELTIKGMGCQELFPAQLLPGVLHELDPEGNVSGFSHKSREGLGSP